MKDMQLENPLLPDYDFDAHLVAGITEIFENEELDFVIDRPNGMKGYIINLTTEGEGTISNGDQNFYVKKGDLLLFPPQTVHYYHRREGSPVWHHRWIYFRPRGFWSELLTWQTQNCGIFLTTGLSDFIQTTINNLFKEIESSSKSKASYDQELATNLLEQLLIRCKKMQLGYTEKMIDPRILASINIMMDDISTNYTIDEIAPKVFLSPSRFTHLFRESMGMTITQWRDDQRINYAKQLLTTSQFSINRIAKMVGYSDPLYFSRIFKKIAGVSPKYFRKG